MFCHQRWKRRFGNRVETDTSPSDELPTVELPHNLERVEEVTARPYVLNNKIYPGTPGYGKVTVLGHITTLLYYLDNKAFQLVTTTNI